MRATFGKTHEFIWSGISNRYTFWFDINPIFSIDIGRYFLRLYLRLKQWTFCRYLGIIRC